MQIAKGVEMLEISAVIMGAPNTIYPTLFLDSETVILVDTGYPGQLALIREEMEKAEVPFSRLNKIIITHQDIDHIGCLPNIVEEAAQKVEVLAHELEKPYIQGDKRLLKITPESIKAAMDALPPELPEEMRMAFKARLENTPKAQVNRTLEDGEVLPYSGGITVVHTPGHVPGHICLYHAQSKTLITGDALNIINGELVGANPKHSSDMDSAKKSLQKLTQYDIEAVISYHGGLFVNNPNQRIAELAKED
jgi:glyoxylase-like metal-dependent hydrolase (beta-lactamase superfamily II)